MRTLRLRVRRARIATHAVLCRTITMPIPRIGTRSAPRPARAKSARVTLWDEVAPPLPLPLPAPSAAAALRSGRIDPITFPFHSMTTLTLIVARANNGVIGRDNQLPGDFPKTSRFSSARRWARPSSWAARRDESIGRPLPGRRNIVVTRDATRRFRGLRRRDHARRSAEARGARPAPEAFLIGGAQLYVEGLRLADKLIVTEISADFRGDATFPPSTRTSGKKSRTKRIARTRRTISTMRS